ncbi:MAG: hypothetical protein HC806_08160 [Anaerolineae bacterium]|nr:hypothetical protein [Anaerolineae bacterium]
MIDEGIQFLLPSRVFDPIDIGFNALAGFMAVTGNVALTWARSGWQKWRGKSY